MADDVSEIDAGGIEHREGVSRHLACRDGHRSRLASAYAAIIESDAGEVAFEVFGLRQPTIAVDPDALSPREALDLLYQLKRLGA